MIKYISNKNKTKKIISNESLELFNSKNMNKVYKFHKSMKESYNQTPLVSLDCLAEKIGIAKFYVKDESKRGNLKAFKLLGGSYAVANCICKKLKISIEDIDFEYLQSKDVKEQLGSLTFAAASDGNHGKSVAWAANKFNQKSVVYMPKGTAKDRIDAIEKLNGTVIVSDYNYDWCVSEVERLKEEKGWEVVLDTASEGDPKVAKWVMQGYMTMTKEVIDQLKDEKITHVFLQAGVGSMASSACATLVNNYKNKLPKMYTIEPHVAACFYESGIKNEAISVEGELDSIMAGLACGVPNPIAWDILSKNVEGFFSCDDYLSANGMRILANPLGTDEEIISGESGAIGTGFVEFLMRNNKELANKIDLNSDSRVLVFSTEGDTDRENYQNTLWYGKYPE